MELVLQRQKVIPFKAAVNARRDRSNPTLWEALEHNPLLPVSAESRRMQIRNLQRGGRVFVRPFIRMFCLLAIHLVLFVKRLLPFRVASDAVMNWMGPRFMVRCTSPESLDFVLRHFVMESNLINFVARNAGVPGVKTVDLHPTCAAGLGRHHGMNAVVAHDANIFNLFIDLGACGPVDLRRHSGTVLDTSMLRIPQFNLAPRAQRWMNLDLESSLAITVLCLALFMDVETAERAVNSFQLDESLLAAISDLTGDPTYRTWTPVKFPNWLGISSDPIRDLHWHMIVNEYAHTRLQQLTPLPAGEAAPPPCADLP